MFHGNLDTRHDVIGLAAIIGRITGEETYVRWHESMWQEKENPTTCDWCGHEEHYSPIVGWTFASGYGPENDPYNGQHSGGAFCCQECHYRWEWKHHPETYRDNAEDGNREWVRTHAPPSPEKQEIDRRKEENRDISEWSNA